MLNVFISSTFRDLEKERKELIKNLDAVLEAAAMEKFIPHGTTSQEDAITELRKSDVIIFLISPDYGTLLPTCVIKDCEAHCSMKADPKERISYTHCEYIVSRTEKKPHQTYRVELPTEERDINFEKTRKKYEKFEKEVKMEFCPEIMRTPEDMRTITAHLSHNIVRWYASGEIHLRDFCGRKEKLKELLDKMELGSVEVFGVGGIGKTTLVQVALLLQILRGKTIIPLTREPSYITEKGEKRRHITGSGYIHFKRKVEEHVVRERITLADVMDALNVPDDVRIKGENEKIDFILKKIKKENSILFIDDFHAADRSVEELVKSSENVVVCSRRKPGLASSAVHVEAIEDIDEFISLKSEGKISEEVKEKIKEVAEGHPVSTIILVRNCQKIDFDALENFKMSLKVSKEEYAEEFLRRVIEEVLSREALEMLRVLALLNPRLKRNIEVDCLEKVYGAGFLKMFGELVDACMVEKREEGVYQFCFHHIQDVLVEDKRERHEMAARYYGEKMEKYEGIEDRVERFYHVLKVECTPELVDGFLSLCEEVHLVERETFWRLTEIGEELRELLEGREKGAVSGALGNLYWNLRQFDKAEKAYKEALEIRKELAEKNFDAYSPGLLRTQINIGVLYIDTDRTEKGINTLEKAAENDLPPDFRAVCFAALARGYETLKNHKAPPCYFLASANYFIQFNYGVHCLDDVLYYLTKVIKLGTGELKEDALLMKNAIEKLSDPQKKIKIPEISHSPRQKTIIEAFKGRKFQFEPKDDIDIMALILAEHIRSSHQKSADTQ